MALTILQRPRRNRKSDAMRRLVRETQLGASDFVYPIFVQEEETKKTAIGSMPGVYRYPVSLLPEIGQELVDLSIPACALFPVISESKKSTDAKEALNDKGLIGQAIRVMKDAHPNLLVITDVALDPYSSDGHDGLLKEGRILNDETVAILADMAVIHAAAGADIVAPSDMMDGRVGAIRQALDASQYSEVNILSYCIKYASSLYGPFRDALQSEPKKGDKKTYQMDIANHREALLEATLDIQEGADILMVKPALYYLDVIQRIKTKTNCPIAAYQVSGEYAMIKAAGKQGFLNEQDVLLESLTAIKRAGADIIFSYGAIEVVKQLNSY